MTENDDIQYNLTIKFSEFNDAIAKLKSIAHPQQLEIVKYLIRYKNLTVIDLQGYLNLPQPIVSHHLSKLKVSNVVDCKREGKSSIHFMKNGPLNYLILNKCS